ncbi:hypothetical protein [Nannocystis exedens]|uniref:hypothetical protein n=1 Tax=Nannocystis exedens TaxID=54 RepID=UPI000BD0B76C|nr:hypothetical protein [Nannocystis exedens]PCC69334.1 hypothetical protein NAEX_02356 [Nannocystis exedens]
MHELRKRSGLCARYRRICTLAAPAVVAVLMAAAPRLALAVEHKLCLRWRVQAIDLSAGTHVPTTATQWPARGVRVQVTPTGGGAIIAAGRTDLTNACFTFQVFGLPGDPTPPPSPATYVSTTTPASEPRPPVRPLDASRCGDFSKRLRMTTTPT